MVNGEGRKVRTDAVDDEDVIRLEVPVDDAVPMKVGKPSN